MSTDTHIDEHTTHESSVKKDLKDRLLLPFGLPFISAAVVILMGVSFSRIFLAGGHQGGEEEAAATAVEHASKSSAPVMWATIITLIVLCGAAGISIMKSMKKTTFGLLIAGGVVTVILAGSVLAGASDVKEAAVEFGRPTPEQETTFDPANTLEIDALGTNEFQSTSFTATPGVIDIVYVGKGGSHRLKFANDARFNWFDLGANPGSRESQKVFLEAGEYTVFCPIAGHTKMVATLEVK